MTSVTIRMLTVWLSFAAFTCAADTRPMLNGNPIHDSVILHSVQRPEDALALLSEDSAQATGIIAAWLQSGFDAGPEGESAPTGEVIPPPPVVRVGSDQNCQFSSIQAAIDASSSAEIRVARNHFYTAQDLVIQNKDITLRGGFADCGASIRTLPNTVLNGAGNGVPGDRKPVIRILSTGNLRTVRLEGLTIQGGLTTTLPLNCSESDRNGAGLNIRGRVRVFLTDVTVRNNQTSSRAPSNECVDAVQIRSNSGGGIYFDGFGHADSLVQFNAGVVVADNAASAFSGFTNSFNHGGGIACRRGDLRLAHHAIAVARNSAGTPGQSFRSFGGGISLDDCRFLSEAGGLLAGIFENETFSTVTPRDGGGIFARNSELVFRKHPLSGNFGPAVVANRSAGNGGGIHISNGTLEARELTVAANHAANEGGGIYATGGPLAIAWSRDGHFNCPAGASCNRISGNTAAKAAGAMLLRFATSGAHADLRQIVIENNRAETGSALLIRGGSSVRLDLEGALISGQEPEPPAPEEAALILVAQGAHLRMSHVSIADNPGHAATVLNNGGQLELYASLLSEDGGIAVETAGGGSTTARCLLASEIASLPSHGSVQHWPYSRRGVLFRNPDVGDYHPGSASPALDFCDGSFTVYPNDLFLGQRGRDLPWVPNRPGEFSGPYDLGAIEDHETLFLDRFEFD